MRIYLSDLTLDIIDVIKEMTRKYFDFYPNVLMPYGHDDKETNTNLDKLINCKSEYKSIMVDSGTYVMNSMIERYGKTYDMKKEFNKYCGYISEYEKEIDYYINYDYLFSGENAFPVNKGYFEDMSKRGLKSIYVMHSFDRDEIDYIKDKHPEIVAIASARLKTKKEFDAANSVINEFYYMNPMIRVHLLGCNSFYRLSETKAWSCDASSYARWASTGRMIYLSYSQEDKKYKEVTLSRISHNKKGEVNKDYYNLDSMLKYKYEYEDYIYKYLGLTVDDIIGDDKNLIIANAFYMYTLEERITNIQKNKGVVFDEW